MRALDRISDNLKAKNVIRAITAVQVYLVGEIKERSLSGQILHVRTGRLRGSITHSPVMVNEGQWIGYVGPGANGREEIPYARPLEEGAIQHRVSTRGKAYTIKTPAFHWLSKPFKWSKKTVKEMLHRELFRKKGF